ncbi:MAG: hypothetical protein U0T81_09045 [Saprospiraceae bacterium]
MFGRPIGSEHTVKHSVGRFGVGMKHCLKSVSNLKLKLNVEQTIFQVSVNVDSRLKEVGGVEFGFTIVDTPTDDLGTLRNFYSISKNLNERVIDEFANDIFIKNLKR